MVLPEGVRNDFYTAEMGRKTIQLRIESGQEHREHSEYSDSLLHSGHVDSMLTFGILIPRSSLVGLASECRMSFGTDSVRNSIHYAEVRFYKEEEQGSVLRDVLYSSQRSERGHDPYEKSNTAVKRMIIGTIGNTLMPSEASFWFEHTANFNFDSPFVNGYLKTGTDSFFIKPFCKVIPLHGKNVKPMQVLEGYGLWKEDSLVAFLQHAPLVKSLYKSNLKDRIYINPISSKGQQRIFVAYFYLVSRLVGSMFGGVLY